MLTLRLKFQGKQVDEFQFDGGAQIITFGRDPDCSVHIDNIGVSRQHCRLYKVGQVSYILQDLNSNNGTFVSGNRVTQWNLNHGDEFYMGKFGITYENPEQEMFSFDGSDMAGSSTPASHPEMGMMTMGVDARDMERLQRRQASKLAGYLEFRDGRDLIQKFPLMKNPTYFGKDASCQIRLQGWGLGARHAMIFNDGISFMLHALVPGKPVFVNGEPTESATLKQEDRLRIGKREFRFFFGRA